MSSREIRYRKQLSFPVSAQEMWMEMLRVDVLEGMWSWLGSLRSSRAGLEPGTVFAFEVAPLLPYRMSVEARLIDVVPERYVLADVSGDLRGPARIELDPEGAGVRLTLSWEVEIQHAGMRRAARVAPYAVRKSHDWAVAVAARAFRRHLERSRGG